MRHGSKILKKVYFKAHPNGTIEVRDLPLEPKAEPDTLIYFELDIQKTN
jgi:hypothetical protein